MKQTLTFPLLGHGGEGRITPGRGLRGAREGGRHALRRTGPCGSGPGGPEIEPRRPPRPESRRGKCASRTWPSLRRHPAAAMTRTCWRRCTASVSRTCPRGTHASRTPPTAADVARPWPSWQGTSGRTVWPAMRVSAPTCCRSTPRVTARCRPSRGKPARSWEPPIALICRVSGQPVVELPSSGLDPESQADFSF